MDEKRRRGDLRLITSTVPYRSQEGSELTAPINMGDPWEVASSVDELSKSGAHDEAIERADTGLRQHPDSDRLRSAKAWALYRRDLRTLGETPDLAQRRRAKAAVETISELVGDDRYGKFSPLASAVLRLSKTLIERYPKAALDLLRTLDPAQLSSASNNPDFPSDRGNWYLKATSALKEAKSWEELVDVAGRGLRSGSLRAEDEVYVRHRLGLGLLELKRPAEALEPLRAARATKPEWWLDLLIGDALIGLGQTDEATAVLARVASEHDRSPFAFRAFTRLAELLVETDPTGATACVQQARHLRTKKGWPVDAETEAISSRLGNPEPPETRPNRKVLRSTLDALLASQRSAGTVSRVLPKGGSGFVDLDDEVPGVDGRIYFAMPRGTDAPAEGTRVTFEVVDGYDRAKDRPSKKAVNMRPA
jgi:tetratricopeptide (TPR) repeat protein